MSWRTEIGYPPRNKEKIEYTLDMFYLMRENSELKLALKREFKQMDFDAPTDSIEDKRKYDYKKAAEYLLSTLATSPKSGLKKVSLRSEKQNNDIHKFICEYVLNPHGESDYKTGVKDDTYERITERIDNVILGLIEMGIPKSANFTHFFYIEEKCYVHSAVKDAANYIATREDKRDAIERVMLCVRYTSDRDRYSFLEERFNSCTNEIKVIAKSLSDYICNVILLINN